MKENETLEEIINAYRANSEKLIIMMRDLSERVRKLEHPAEVQSHRHTVTQTYECTNSECKQDEVE